MNKINISLQPDKSINETHTGIEIIQIFEGSSTRYEYPEENETKTYYNVLSVEVQNELMTLTLNTE